FNTSDRLYFEPLFLEDVLNVIEQEKPIGVIVQFGGQTAINLAEPLQKAGVRILGSDLESIDTAEDRKKFEALLRQLDVAQQKAGVSSLGTKLESIDKGEVRKEFEALQRQRDVAQTAGSTVTSVEQAVGTAAKRGYPVLGRPAYVLGGRAMEIVYSDEELLNY